MKIITLMPFRNEEFFLKTSIPSVYDIADEIVCINDRSTDNSGKVASELGATVYENTKNNEYGSVENQVRSNLLKLGREHKGTHFIFLDADEALSSNLKDNMSFIKKLDKGQSAEFMWMSIWKSLDRYKNDKSVWTNNYKDFVYHDDKIVNFEQKQFKNQNYKKYDVSWPTHPARTPSLNRIRFGLKTGAVLHYQFANWEAFQLKQCWYRCAELIQNDGQNAGGINDKYRITLEADGFVTDIKNKFKTKKIPKYLDHDINRPNLDDLSSQYSWRLDQIENWFNDLGKDYFRDLEIWHLDSIKNINA
jgi:glycosyltransferase involved in cell wall biosynthesis